MTKQNPKQPKNFAVIGVGGYIAPRHLQAISDTHNRVVCALDPSDSVGILDRYSDEVHFFTEFERFDREIERRRQSGDPKQRVDYVSICSPNYLHDSHMRFALRVDADAICEKPLVLNPWNVDALAELERQSGHRAWTVLQLRHHPAIQALKEKYAEPPNKRIPIDLCYVTSRGPWYHHSWKGQLDKAGGITTNIGIHFFDMLGWIFGPVQRMELHLQTAEVAAGILELERADVRWFLSLRRQDLPLAHQSEASQVTHRSILIDGEEIEFSRGFKDLHTVVYEQILQGKGYGLTDARPSISLVHDIRNATATGVSADSHPLAKTAKL